MNDPSLLHTSVGVQFKKFIVEPFVEQLWNVNPHRIRFFILIDGLDECEGHHTQCELLRLISNFCTTHPTSPLIWVVASRPEPHITSFFSNDEVVPASMMQEVGVDSTQACEDVERFLRRELKEVQRKSPALKDLPQWPTERDFLKLAYASKGLFAYASTAVKFVDDPAYGDPALQLEQVLDVIDTNPMRLVEGKTHPMALLDALYSRILSRVPLDVMANTRKILLLMIDHLGRPNDIPAWMGKSFNAMCNWLGMTKNTAYGATYHFRSVLDVPGPADAPRRALQCFHKSFTDYLEDFERSGFCRDIGLAVQELNSLCAPRILEEAPNGTLDHGPGTTTNISLSWPQDKEQDNNSMRTCIHRHAATQVVKGLSGNIPAFQNTFFIRALNAFDESSLNNVSDFPEFLFDESRRSEFMENNVLRQIPVRLLDSLDIPTTEYITYQFRGPAKTVASIPAPWHSSCEHFRWGNFEEAQDQNWTSSFKLNLQCNCRNSFLHRFESSKTGSPDDLVKVFIPVTLRGFVEYRFVEPENGAVEWVYIFPYRFPSRMGT